MSGPAKSFLWEQFSFCREGFSQISVDLSRKARDAEDEQNSVSRMKIKPITHTHSTVGTDPDKKVPTFPRDRPTDKDARHDARDGCDL